MIKLSLKHIFTKENEKNDFHKKTNRKKSQFLYRNKLGKNNFHIEKSIFALKRLNFSSDCNASLKSGSFSSKVSSLPETIDYDTETLRLELTSRGFNPGPITATTKRVYLKKLRELEKRPVEKGLVAVTNERGE